VTYLVIDTDGALHIRDQTPTLDAINAEVGDGGKDQVRLRLAGARGFVNDVGFRAGLPRNVVGSLLLMCCGASQQPYAGPVVITGWDDYGRDTEIVPLPADVLGPLRALHADLRAILAGDTPCGQCSPEWIAQVRKAAAFVVDALTPTITIHRGLPT